jgi:hypothetical protein
MQRRQQRLAVGTRWPLSRQTHPACFTVARMVRRFALVPAMLLLAACGGSTLSPSDGGQSSDVTLGDGGVGDAGAPLGQLVQGDHLTLVGVTDDDYAVYTDDDAKTLNAVPLAGGTPQLISALTDQYVASVSGRVAVVLTAATPPDASALPTFGCTLVAWSSSTGVHTLSSAASSLGFAVSEDSSRIMYPDGLDGGAISELRGANVDGTGATPLMRLSTQGGIASGAVSEAHGSYFVVEYTPADGTGDTIASSFRTDNWSRADLLLNSVGYTVDPGATKVLGNSDGGIYWVPIDGGAAHTIDPAGDIAYFSPEGANVIYRAGCCGKGEIQIRHSPLSPPSPVTLVHGGALDVVPGAISPDGNWVVFHEGEISSGVFRLYVVSTTGNPPGVPILLPIDALSWANSSASFTNDSSHVISFTEIGGAGVPAVGKLQATGVGDGSTRTLAAASFVAEVVVQTGRLGYQPLGPSRVVFTANTAYVGMLGWTADIDIADTATAASPVTIVSSVNPTFFLSRAGDRLVYTTFARTGPSAGLYVAAIP